MWLLGVFRALLLAVNLASCGSHADHKTLVREHEEELEARTIPPRSALIASSETKFDGWGVSRELAT